MTFMTIFPTFEALILVVKLVEVELLAEFIIETMHSKAGHRMIRLE